MSNYDTLTYTGLEYAVNSGGATDVVFNLPAGPSAVILADDGDAPGNGLSRIYSSTIALTDISNPTGSLTINRANAADTIVVNDLPDINAALALGSRNSPFSTIIFSGVVALDPNKPLSASARTISVTGPILTSGGSIDLGTTSGITIDADLNTHGGQLALNADTDGDGVGTLTTKFDFFSQQRLDSPTGINFGQFGAAVAVSSDGNTLIVGAPSEDANGNTSEGTATVFVRSGESWIVQQQLKNTNGSNGDNFGGSVALSADGNTAIVGAFNEDVGLNMQQGTATVFVRSGGVWTAQQKLTLASGATRNRFGANVALSGNGSTAVFGVSNRRVGNNLAQGSVVVFTHTGGVWTQQQELTATGGADGDRLGAVAVTSDGNTILAGASNGDIGSNVNQGYACVFVRSGGVWTEQQKLTASTAAAGDWFGWSVALSSDGNTAMVGALEGHLGADPDRGFVSVFMRAAGVWSEQQQLTAGNPTSADRFGTDVALSGDGNTAVVTAEQHNATVFIRSSGVWTRQPQIPAPGFAAALSNDGDVLLVGNSREWVGNNLQNSQIGRARVLAHPRIRAGGQSITATAADMQLGSPMITSGAISLLGSQVNRPIELGSEAVGSLGLTDVELDLMAASALQIGDDNSGPITIDGDITRPTATNVHLTSGGAISFSGGLFDTGGGDLHLSPGSAASVGVHNAGADISLGDSGTLSFANGSNLAIAINGTAVDSQYEQLHVIGKIDLTGANLALSGSHTPAVGESLVVVNNRGSEPLVGEFNSLPEGIVFNAMLGSLSVPLAITYQGGDGNDVVVTRINTAPSFIIGPDVNTIDEKGLWNEDWASAVVAGLPDEAEQNLSFVVLPDHPNLFSIQPAIDASGILTFTPKPNVAGITTISVQLHDSGGSKNGGSDSSAVETFTITITKPHSWYNAALSYDVDGDGKVAPIDALLIINYLNSMLPTDVPTGGAFGIPFGFLDTDHDNSIAPIDALLVINALNAGAATAGQDLSHDQQFESASEHDSDSLDALIALLALDTDNQVLRRSPRAM
jgi:hypothetical protein